MTRHAEQQFQEGMQKISDLSRDIAQQEGVMLTSVVLDDGREMGCTDYHVLDLSAGESMVSVKLHHNEIEDFPGHAGIDLTEAKIRSAVDRLKILLAA